MAKKRLFLSSVCHLVIILCLGYSWLVIYYLRETLICIEDNIMFFEAPVVNTLNYYSKTRKTGPCTKFQCLFPNLLCNKAYFSRNSWHLSSNVQHINNNNILAVCTTWQITVFQLSMVCSLLIWILKAELNKLFTNTI